eukprot:scaffold2864_cov422-Pavlova_lutheri.AAC.2
MALARPPPFPVARRRRGWWRRRAFALVRSCVRVAAVLETVGRNVEERCCCSRSPAPQLILHLNSIGESARG